jgi:hypothetical protein
LQYEPEPGDGSPTQGFSGLKPKGKGRRRSEDAIPASLLEQAILLRRQVPGRSIAQIIQILEWEGLAQPGQLKRSTLQEKLTERGYSARHMRIYAETGIAARRFQKKYRNQLWHSDIKYPRMNTPDFSSIPFWPLRSINATSLKISLVYNRTLTIKAYLT